MSGDVRAEYDAMLRQRAGLDPGDPGPVGDPAVSRVIYALRDLHVTGRATAEDVLDAVGSAAWLRPEQRTAVLAAFYRPAPLSPQGPAYIPPGRERAD